MREGGNMNIEFIGIPIEMGKEIKERFVNIDKELSGYGYKIKSVIFNSQIYSTGGGGYYEIFLNVPKGIINLMGPWEEDSRNKYSWNKVPLRFIDKFKKECHIHDMCVADHYPYYSKNRDCEETIKINIGCAVVEDEFREKRGWRKDWDKNLISLFKNFK